MTTKPFNSAVFKKTDGIARVVAKPLFLLLFGLHLINNPDTLYKIDMIDPDKNVAVELETRDLVFNPNGTLKYNSLHVPARKAKYCKGVEGYYCTLSADLKYAAICPLNKVMSAPVKEVRNKAVASDEYFYDVPVSDWQIVETPENPSNGWGIFDWL